MGKSKGRWNVHQALTKESKLRPYLLESKPFSEKSLIAMLEMYNTILIKPSYGRFDIGSIIVNKANQQYYQIGGQDDSPCYTERQLFQQLDKYLGRDKRFIMQPIFNDMGKMDDYFLVVLNNLSPENKWNIAGIIKKTSYNSQFIEIDTKNSQIEDVALIAATQIKKEFEESTQICIYMCLDSNGSLKIVEVNPSFFKDKWMQYLILLNNLETADSIPETNILTETNLLCFLDRHQRVVIKPSLGYRGKNITLVTQKEKLIELHRERLSYRIESPDSITQYLETNIFLPKNLGYYLVQQYLDLATIKDCPFDIRLLLNKITEHKWVLTNAAARVAADGYFITNATKDILTVEEALNKWGFKGVKADSILFDIEQLGLAAAKSIHSYFPEFDTIGMDIGIDKTGKCWFIEANFRPDMKMFNKLAAGQWPQGKEFI